MNANEVVTNYIAAWNERDPVKRRAVAAKAWASNGTYVDPHRKASGLDEIDAMLGVAQASFPGYQVRLISKIEAHNEHIRFSWAAGGTPEAPLYLGGTDFIRVGPDGLSAAIVGFVDATPAM
jgi:SnoaL-like domain